jgi:uncharacterized protein (TIGR03435 family)
MRLMMQALLAERLHLVVHYTTADAPVFALVVAKPSSGPKLHPHPATDGCVAPLPDQPLACGVIGHVPGAAPAQHYGGRSVPLSLFATSVPTMTGLAAMPRPVIDQTGLTGLYDFTLSWVHDSVGGDVVVTDNAANFREALKTQLGLELKPSHAHISFLLIDHVERPSEN